MRFKVFRKLKNKIKALLDISSEVSYKSNSWTSFNIPEEQLRQKRICDNWSIEMISQYYQVDEKYMKEILLLYGIK
jgi:phage-related protein